MTVQPMPVVYEGNLYLVADEGSNGYELWMTDGTTNGTQKISPEGATVYSPLAFTNEMTLFNNGIYFAAEYDNHGRELWKLESGGASSNTVFEELFGFTLYPNPCEGSLSLRYQIKDERYQLLDIFSISGYKICELEKGMKKPGVYEMEFDVSGLPAGMYFIRFMVGGQVSMKKLIVKK